MTDTTTPAPDQPAYPQAWIEAVAQALHKDDPDEGGRTNAEMLEGCRSLAEDVLTAAWPLISAWHAQPVHQHSYTGVMGGSSPTPLTAMSATIDLRCPVCDAVPGARCRTTKTDRTTDFHSRRANTPGFTGRDAEGRQQCLACWGWKYPVIHSCPGVPQPGRTPPLDAGSGG